MKLKRLINDVSGFFKRKSRSRVKLLLENDDDVSQIFQAVADAESFTGIPYSKVLERCQLIVAKS